MAELLTVAQVAARLGLTRFHVARLIQAGRLKAIKPGHDYLVDADDLAAFQRRPVGRPTGSKDTKPRRKTMDEQTRQFADDQYYSQKTSTASEWESAEDYVAALDSVTDLSEFTQAQQYAIRSRWLHLARHDCNED